MQMKKIKLYLRITMLISYMMEENLFVNVVSCKACSFTVFRQKKCHTHIYTHTRTHTKNRKRVTPEWTDILDGRGFVSFLSESSMYYITQTLHNPINLLNVVSTVFLEHLFYISYMVYKHAETAGTGPINHSNQKPFVFPSSCLE